ncbi:MAG: division/cell wall cluster transcriptional repressor MraZ [Acidobacteria bacterium]|nr:division/cell wall cluster transcriptional repressor MraZ [Acidobacteriota bacterium]
MLRGNHPAKIDDKGRLKIPNGYRTTIEEKHGRAVFVTSIRGTSVRIYPMPVWLDLERRLDEQNTSHPVIEKFLERVAVYGQEAEIDAQGRVLIQPRLRQSAQMEGEVDVLGHRHFLEVWNHDRLMARLENDQFTREDQMILAGFGI